MVNLETAVTERGEPVPKTYNFRAPPVGVPALRSAGVDVVSLANNHGMDFGEVGLLDTLDAAEDPATGLPAGRRRAGRRRGLRALPGDDPGPAHLDLRRPPGWSTPT